jgi:hypothetical protein
VGLFNFVEQNDGVGLTAYRFGQLTAFVVADVSGRSTNETAHGMTLLVLAHVDPRHHLSIVEEVLGQGFGEFGFTNTGRSEEEETTDGLVLAAKSGTAEADGVGDGLYCFILADDALV